ncbi:MAG: NAD(P)/FAD-dependent oxidoreductase [Pseudohongiellaceae bacterium]
MVHQDHFDIVIIGAGIIGLAIARQLTLEPRFRSRSILVLDQERGFGQHTSSRNSEVIHAGIYYPTGSLKARLCVRGKALLYDYCQRHAINHRACGKLIVAQPGEESKLEALKRQAWANGVEDLELLERHQIAALEPDVRASAALLSPSTGIVDSHHLMQSLLHDAQRGDVLFAPLTRVTGLRRLASDFAVTTRAGDGRDSSDYQFRCAALINCAGLWASDIATMLDAEGRPGEAFPPSTYYCRGDYYSYLGPARFRHLVYPLPEAGTRGLGIHATLDLGGQIRFGPDSHYQSSLGYALDASKAALFARAISRYLPSITASQLQPAYSGIRPKLAGPGQPAADCMIATGSGAEQDSELHLLGIESPGLTASLALAEAVTARLPAL